MPALTGSSRPETLVMDSRPSLMRSSGRPIESASPTEPIALNTENRPGMGRFMRQSPTGVCRSNCTPRVVMSMFVAERSARSRTPKVRIGMERPSMMRSA